jgi:hypothetical protein
LPSRWRGVLGGGALASAVAAVAVIAAAVPSSIGCATHQCDPNSHDYFDGYMVSADVFVTNALDEPWLSYPGNATIRVWLPLGVAGRTIDSLAGWVGTVPLPNEPGGFAKGLNYVPTSGQLSEFSEAQTPAAGIETDAGTDAGTKYGGNFKATNGTCAPYFARFLVQFVPIDAGADADDHDSSESDAGTGDADATEPDAGTGDADSSE